MALLGASFGVLLSLMHFTPPPIPDPLPSPAGPSISGGTTRAVGTTRAAGTSRAARVATSTYCCIGAMASSTRGTKNEVDFRALVGARDERVRRERALRWEGQEKQKLVFCPYIFRDFRQKTNHYYYYLVVEGITVTSSI